MACTNLWSMEYLSSKDPSLATLVGAMFMRRKKEEEEEEEGGAGGLLYLRSGCTDQVARDAVALAIAFDDV